MSRIERFTGRNGNEVELRYAVDTRTDKEFLDEIVTDGPIHVEILSDDVCWADINGIRVTWGAVKKGELRFQAEPDEAIPIEEADQIPKQT